MQDLTSLFNPIRQAVYDGEPKVGVHVNWNAPKGGPQPAWETLLGILSACYWTSVNGPVDLYTDEIGLQKVETLGLKGLYRNVKLLDKDMSSGFDPKMFWAAGKFMAMLECDEPAYFIDQDLVLTKSIEHKNADLIFFHKEKLTPDWYPPTLLAYVAQTYGFPDITYAFNCALVRFKDVEKMREYAANSLRFINKYASSVEKFPSEAVMCSIEQFGLQQYCQFNKLSTEPIIQAIYTPHLTADHWDSNEHGVNDMDSVADWCYHSWAEKGHLRNDFQASLDFAMHVITILERKLGTSMDPLIEKLNFRNHL